MLPTCTWTPAPNARDKATIVAARKQSVVATAFKGHRAAHPQQECQQHTVLSRLSSSRCRAANASALTRALAGNGNGDRTAGSDAANSSSSGANGSGSEAAGVPPLENGGNGSSGNGGSGSRGPGQPSGGDQNGGDGFKLPLSSEQLSKAVLALAALSAVQLISLLWQASALTGLDSALHTVINSLGGMADGESTRDSVAALKRLLREVFADQLTIKQRLSDAEKAATVAAQLEAADDYQLQQAVGGSSSWVRAPVRMSGHITAAGVLPWTQETDGPGALAMLSGLGVGGAADARLQLHSVLAGGKRRITAEFSQAAQQGAAAALKLQALLFRVHAKSWLKLMIAALGGGLEALGRSITPVRDFGCTQALRQGHGLSVLQQHGSGKAISMSRRNLCATAGFFIGGASKTGLAHFQARSQDGHSLSLVAAHSRPQASNTCSASGSSSSSCEQLDRNQGFRFLGAQSPQAAAAREQQMHSGHVLGAVGVVAVNDVCTATAWTERPLRGQAGWGAGLYCQPDEDGLELGVALGKPSAAHQSLPPRPLFIEVSAKLPAGDGLSISPCAVFTHRAGASSLAYVMQSCWRW